MLHAQKGFAHLGFVVRRGLPLERIQLVKVHVRLVERGPAGWWRAGMRGKVSREIGVRVWQAHARWAGKRVGVKRECNTRTLQSCRR